MINFQNCKREKQAIDLFDNTRAAEFISCKTVTSREFLRLLFTMLASCSMLWLWHYSQNHTSTIRPEYWGNSWQFWAFSAQLRMFSGQYFYNVFSCVQHFQTLLRHKVLDLWDKNTTTRKETFCPTSLGVILNTSCKARGKVGLNCKYTADIKYSSYLCQDLYKWSSRLS